MILNRTCLSLFVVLCAFFARAQREYHITKIDTPPVIDGVLDEPQWSKTESADDFTTSRPIYGEKSRFKSEFHLYYDDDAIYIAGHLRDPNPDSISYSLSQRDDTGNADWAGVSIDPYANNVNAFGFLVTAAGVEIDGLESITGFDGSWNSVWRSAVSRTEEGWSFEMKIPYSAIRFPNKRVQEWNVNFRRSVRRVREESQWNPVDPNVYGVITQSGKLFGIENVRSPLRLSLTPYGTVYAENSYDYELGKQTWKMRPTYGMDLKYGLNDAFTLDMTLIPDFGQTTSDRQILNLGPFEVRYNENRPFFIEGTELFQQGGIFYSRRIGGRPFNYGDAYNNLNDSLGESVISNPQSAPLINGTKVSGRTSKGLGIGMFNALEGETNAIISNEAGVERQVKTNPLTNYNILVLSQNMQNNSTASLTNTNVLRGDGNRDANVTAGQLTLFTKDGDYRLSATTKISAIMEDVETDFGHTFGMNAGKVSGKYQYSLGYWEESDRFDPNDLGFLYNNNSRGYSANMSWNDYEGSKRFYRRSANIGVWYDELYKPQLFSGMGINWFVGGLHKKQLYTRLSGSVNPLGNVNHFESRSFGKEVKYNPNANISWFFTSDYSKRFALDGRYSFQNYFGRTQYRQAAYLSPRLRLSDRTLVVLDANVEFIKGDYGYVSKEDDNYGDQIILGYRDRTIVENSIRGEFIFTQRMGVDFRLRHYWQQVNYDGFAQLLDEGEMIPSDYNPINEDGTSVHNTSYNAFTVDVNYRWIFIPGSELRIVYKNNIFNSSDFLEESYFSTFGTIFDQPQINSISMRLLVYLDAMYFRFKKKRQEV